MRKRNVILDLLIKIIMFFLVYYEAKEPIKEIDNSLEIKNVYKYKKTA